MENSRELLLLVDAVAKEKGLTKDEILSPLAEGIETALRKNFPEGALIQVDIDEHSGNITAWRLYELVDHIDNVEAQMLHSEVENEHVSDGYAWERFDFTLNRQQFNITKQVALQKIKSQAKEHQIEELLNKPVKLYQGVVKVVKKDYLIAECSGIDIVVPKRNLLPKEHYKLSDKIFFTLEQDRTGYVGTRTSDQYLMEVIKHEIIQVEEGDVEVVACARNPGMRSKVIVRSTNGRYDPVKICIGAKGANIKRVQLFTNNEIIDVIAYTEEPAQMLVKAIAPVNINSIIMDEDSKVMEISVDSNEIAQAIGKGGKNIEMISNLLGWKIEVFSTEQWTQRNQSVENAQARYFMYALDCDEELARYLVQSGYSNVEEIAYINTDELDLEELDAPTIEALQDNAKQALADETKMKLANALLTLYGFDFEEQQVHHLLEQGIYTNEDIADLSSYDLQDLIPELDNATAQAVVMKARNQQEKENAS